MIFTVLNKGNEHLFETSFVLPIGKTVNRVHITNRGVCSDHETTWPDEKMSHLLIEWDGWLQ